MGKINGKLLPVIFFVIGIVFVFVGVGMKYQAQHKKKVCTEKTTAEVVEIKRHVSHHTSSKKKRRTTKTTYRPVFKYTALDGRTYKKEGSELCENEKSRLLNRVVPICKFCYT